MQKFIFIVFFFLVVQQVHAQLTQRIRGHVSDHVLTSPLPGVQVVVLNTNPTLGAVTDEHGDFRIDSVPIGRYDIKISSVGYKPLLLTNIEVVSGKETMISVSLEEDVTELAEVVVTASDQITPLNDDVLGSVQLLRTDEINRFAGSRQDVGRMASNYAGVIGGGDQRNDVIIRGNSPNGVLWRLEGVDIPAPNHFALAGNPGGVFSILNNNLLASSDFITGAFPAQYGNKTAGVFDLRMRNGNNERQENIFQAGLNGLEAGTEGPIGKTGSSYLLNGRFFYTGLLDALGADLGASGIPRFWDVSTKINLQGGRTGNYSIWAIGGKSSLANLESKEDKADWESIPAEDDDFASYTFAAGITHSLLIGDNTLSRLSFSFTGNGSRNTKKAVYLNDSSSLLEDFSISEKYLSGYYSIDHKVNKKVSMRFGLHHKFVFYSNRMKEREKGQPDFEYPLGAKDAKPFLTSVFAQTNWRPHNAWQVVAGVYGQWVHLGNKTALEPRISAQYTISDEKQIHVGYGMHSQTHPLLYYFWRSPADSMVAPTKNRDLNLMRAHHFVVGYNWAIGAKLRAKAEVYYQYLYDIPVSTDAEREYFSFQNLGADFSFEGSNGIVNGGTGINQGVELTLERLFSNDLYFLWTASVFDSKYKGYRGSWFNTAFNSNYVFNFLIGKEWRINHAGTKKLSADLRANYSGNRRYIPIDLTESIAKGEEVLDYKNAYANKYPDYFRIDGKIAYTINKAASTHQFFIALDNLTNRKNVFYQEFNDQQGRIKTFYQFGIFPYAAYRINF